VARLEFLDDRKLALARRFAKVYRLFTGWDLTATLDLVEPVYGLMRGVPTEQPMASAYWRKRMPPPADPNPDRDGCGLLWCAPVGPMEGGHAQRLTAFSIDTLLKHGFEPMISISLVTERALTCVVSISYDRAVPGEDHRAMQCYRELLRGLVERGYYSYRYGIQSLEMVGREDAYADAVGRLKRALDPNGILAPGRYGISAPPRAGTVQPIERSASA
jgi:4-cresol dehydrogenase (hydroxylating)